MALDREDYLRWQDLFENMMRQYCPGRDTLLALSVEVIRLVAKGPELALLDLGCGSGAFTRRVLAEFPHARVTGVDWSSRTLHIARALADSDQAAWIKMDLAEENWQAALSQGEFDAAFTGWSIHEIPPWRLFRLYQNAAQSLRPGGLLLNADFVSGLAPGFQELALDLTRGRVTDDWREYNRSLEKDETIQRLLEEDQPQRTRWIVHHARDLHLRKMLEAGFQQAEEIGRYLNSSLMLAIR